MALERIRKLDFLKWSHLPKVNSPFGRIQCDPIKVTLIAQHSSTCKVACSSPVTNQDESITGARVNITRDPVKRQTIRCSICNSLTHSSEYCIYKFITGTSVEWTYIHCCSKQSPDQSRPHWPCQSCPRQWSSHSYWSKVKRPLNRMPLHRNDHYYYWKLCSFP